jgi:hypothetical protein
VSLALSLTNFLPNSIPKSILSARKILTRRLRFLRYTDAAVKFFFSLFILLATAFNSLAVPSLRSDNSTVPNYVVRPAQEIQFPIDGQSDTASPSNLNFQSVGVIGVITHATNSASASSIYHLPGESVAGWQMVTLRELNWRHSSPLIFRRFRRSDGQHYIASRFDANSLTSMIERSSCGGSQEATIGNVDSGIFRAQATFSDQLLEYLFLAFPRTSS